MTAPRLFIQGVERPYERGSMQYDKSITERSPARFTVLDTDVTDHLERLTAVTIHRGDDGVLDWSGFLQTAAETRIGKVASLRVKVRATDAVGLMDSRLAVDTYTLLDATQVLFGLLDEFAVPEGIRLHDYRLIVLNDGPQFYAPLTEAAARDGSQQFRQLTFGIYTDVYSDDYDSGVTATDGGTCAGGAVLGGSADALLFGDPQPSATFDGTTDVDCTTTFTHQPGTDDWSAEVWIDADDTGTVRRVLDSYDATEGWWLDVDTDDTVRLTLDDGTTQATWDTGHAITPGDDTHVAVVIANADDVVRAIVNGTEVASTTLTALGLSPGSSTFDSTTALQIGSGDAGVEPFAGRIGHVAVYGRDLPTGLLDNHWLAGSTGYTANVPTPTIETGGAPVVERFVANYEPVSEAVDRLADLIGWDWFVDERRVFHFRPRGGASAPLTIDTSVVLDDVTVSRKNTRYRNRQYVKGGTATTDPITEEFTGDGARQTFTVAYPLAEEPTVQVDTGGGYVTKTVGIRGVDDPDAFDWYWQAGSTEVSQRSAATPLTSSDMLRVQDYVGQFPFVAISEDNPERQRVEALGHGTGRVEEVDDVPEATDRDAAFQYAAGRLGRRAQDHRVVEFSTRQSGFAGGQVADVDLPLHGLVGQVLLESVSASLRRDVLTYQCKGTEGPVEGSWTEYFERLARGRRSFIEQDSQASEEVVIIVADTDETTQIASTDDTVVSTTQTVPFDVPATLA